MYVWVLDYEDAKVYCYNKWDPDTQSIKEFLITVGHTPKMCKWMINPSKKSKLYNMSKMKELDLVAQGVADHIKEIIEDSVDWQLADQPLEGDDYIQMKEYVINLALNKLLQK